MIDYYIGDAMAQSATLTSILPTIALWLLYGLAGMFLTLAAIITLGAIIYPFYMIFKGIKENLL